MDVTQLVVTVLALLIGAVVGYIVQGKKAAAGAIPDRWDWLLETACEIAVKAAEQLFADGQGEQKLTFAIEYVEKYLAQLGVAVDPVLIRGAIEAAVHSLKDAVKE